MLNDTGCKAMGETHGASCEEMIASNEPAEDVEDYSFLDDEPNLIKSDNEGVDGHEDEEVEPMRTAASPVLPPAADIEEHRMTHMPYRPWCTECNQGRGLGEQRGAHVGQEHSIPLVGVDFWYITTGGVKKREELEWANDEKGDAELQGQRQAGKIIKCLIIRCHKTKCVFAHVIPFKGHLEDPYVVDLTCSDIAWLGHVKLIIKGDNEKALVTLIEKSLRVLRC